jgi:hypothetical protein
MDFFIVVVVDALVDFDGMLRDVGCLCGFE